MITQGANSTNDFVLQLYLRDLAQASAVGSDSTSRPLSADVPGDAGREELVLGQLPRVVRIAFDYQGFGLPLGDLINEGNIGLMRAADRFDPGRNVRFSYYAKPWIRVQMQRAISYQAWPVNLPADFSRRRGQILGTEERLTATLNRAPDDAEVARECHLELPAVRRLRSTPTPSFVPLESPWPGNESGLTLAEVIPDDTVVAPDAKAMRSSDREFIETLMAALSPAEQTAIRLRFGLDDGEGRTLDEIGRLMGFRRQGIHRLEKAALVKLRLQAQRFGLNLAAVKP